MQYPDHCNLIRDQIIDNHPGLKEQCGSPDSPGPDLDIFSRSSPPCLLARLGERRRGGLDGQRPARWAEKGIGMDGDGTVGAGPRSIQQLDAPAEWTMCFFVGDQPVTFYAGLDALAQGVFRQGPVLSFFRNDCFN